MNKTFQAPMGTATLPAWLPAISRRAWIFGAALVAAAFVLALSQVAQAESTSEPEALPLAKAAADLAQRPLLVANGVVETIREMTGAVGGSRKFEMTIRMRDGTMRVSQQTGSAGWRAGDQIMLIGSPAVL